MCRLGVQGAIKESSARLKHLLSIVVECSRSIVLYHAT
jgi:hypothetical protein